jgi:RNA polymerase sigma-70 factor (ECF subfamily)
MQGAAIIASTVTGDRMPAAVGDLDDLLAKVARNADRDAFGRLFGFFAPRLKAYLMRTGAGSDAAEDLAQDVMMKVWRKAKLFDPSKASASTWIYAIARNQRIDAFRRLRRPDFDPNDPTLLPDEALRADEALDRGSHEARIRKAYEKLPPNQLEVVRMHFIEDEPHSAIAEKLKLPLGTVKSRLRLAFEKIRCELGDRP